MAADPETVKPGGEAAFSRDEFAARQVAARQALAARGLDLLVVTGPENIFYLTGQQTPGYYTFQACCCRSKASRSS